MRNAMILILLVLVLIVAACQKAAPQKETLVEILQIEDSCADDAKDGCCQKQCTDFCVLKERSYTKHTVNGQHCGCWCD
jgi:hypothetical protein